MKIVTDCAADIPQEELARYGITQAPLFIQFPEGEVDSADITADAFYDKLEAMRPTIPTTATPSAGIFSDIYRSLAAVDRDILSIHISSGLSATLSAAKLGAEQVAADADVRLWDTQTLSGGERFQVLAAALGSRQGWSKVDIEARMSALRDSTEVIYTLDTLEYLARGGRIGRVQALAGSVLGIKPVINVDHKDGKYSNVGRSRNINGALGFIADHLAALFGTSPVWVTVLHGRFAPKADALASLLTSKLNAARLEVMRISPVLGVHTGPGIVGAAVAPMRLLEDLL